MANLPCKLIAQVAFKAGGDVFHQLFARNPHHLATVTPEKIQSCDLHHGSHGTNDSVVEFKYKIDGKDQTVKYVLQDIDEEKQTITWKTLEGNQLELYKNVTIGLHVETKGGVDFITWTIIYELRDVNNPHPLPLLNLCIELVKDVEAHILG